MRIMSVIAVFVFLLCGCDLGVSSNPSLSATFVLADTSSRPSSVFRPGDDFVMTFSLQNTTLHTLTFYRGDASPNVTFKIIQNDSVVATSIDGFAFIQIPSIGHLAPNQVLQGYWRAPTTMSQVPRKVLTPGLYCAEVSFPRFDQAEIKQVSALEFTIL